MIVSIDEIRELLMSNETFKNIKETGEKLNSLIKENENLTKELQAITGNEDLKQLFEKYKGETLEYKTPRGEKKAIKIITYADLITALVEISIDKQAKTE